MLRNVVENVILQVVTDYSTPFHDPSWLGGSRLLGANKDEKSKCCGMLQSFPFRNLEPESLISVSSIASCVPMGILSPTASDTGGIGSMGAAFKMLDATAEHLVTTLRR